ncbi:branched-chain-amino-acid aminotransferase, cytosolic-like [Agelaius phoeniceus]|uniref:branched-chain-amino-acid aminotransferase, cytosolic-like n=1 Tax=Agelaius phoeniceus TaxID=39638 RepID=UPI004054E520
MAAAALRSRGGGAVRESGGSSGTSDPPVLATLLRPRRGYKSTPRSWSCSAREPRDAPEPPGFGFWEGFHRPHADVEWERERGWGRPRIGPFQELRLHPASSALHYAVELPQTSPFQELRLHPASSALHYAVELFEGLKAFRGDDDKIRLFRPELNMERMKRSARRVCLPEFDGQELLECIRALVRLEGRWSSLYIRPTFIGTKPTLGVAPPGRALLFVLLCPVGPYFSGGFGPIRLLADPQHVPGVAGRGRTLQTGGTTARAWSCRRRRGPRGCQQVLWLHGPERLLTEVGTMNLFVFWERPDGELVTPPLDGLILPGVTRQSLLELARNWGEFEVREAPLAMGSVLGALKGGAAPGNVRGRHRLRGLPGGGDPLLSVPTMENGAKVTTRFLRELSDIQYGPASPALLEKP